MSDYTYRAIWPIVDPDRPMSALVAEASAALDLMAVLDGARITGDPQWTVSGDRLVCAAPATPADDLAETPRQKRERQEREVLRLASLRWSEQQIAATAGVPRSVVRAILDRHARTSTKETA